MSWNTPPDWATTSGISLDSMNKYLRDNLRSLRNNNDWLVKASLVAPQSINSELVYTPVAYHRQDILVGTTALHSTALAARFKAPEPGQYRMLGTMVYASASGWAAVAYGLNGVDPIYDVTADMSENADPRELFFCDVVMMTTADYLQIMGYVERNTSGTLASGSTNTRVTWSLIGAAT